MPTPEQEHPEVFEEYWRQARTRTPEERETLPDTVYVARAYANSPEVATLPSQEETLTISLPIAQDPESLIRVETFQALNAHFKGTPYDLNTLLMEWLSWRKAMDDVAHLQQV